jgi:hypothetical protein
MHDGQFKRICEPEDLEPSMIVREMHNDATVPPFADATVLKRVRERSYLIARPYCIASGLGTTAPPLLGCETFEVSFESLRDRYVLVLTSRGEPFRYAR